MRRTIKFIFSFLIAIFITTGLSQDKIGTSAPDFDGKTSNGKEIKLSDYLGKVVLVDFWASWCVPCQEEMPELVKFFRIHKDSQFVLIGVNIDNEVENMNHFIKQLSLKPEFEIITDTDQHIPSLFDIEAMPTTIFIDKKGKIRYWHDGFKKSYVDDFKKELKQLLKEG